MASDFDPIATPFCGELRSKRFFMLDTIPTESAQYFDPSGHCWCYHTQQAIGPDGDYVGPHECTAARACYRSALQDEAGPTIRPSASPDAGSAGEITS